KNFTLISFLIEIITCIDIIPNIFSLQTHLHANCLRPLQNSPKSPKFPPRHLGDFGEFCKGLSPFFFKQH
ncbi:MAG: hypothetical protein E7I68_10175, partial [Neisseria sp.]|nr:hypothetical protein [Neisseria sp.]